MERDRERLFFEEKIGVSIYSWIPMECIKIHQNGVNGPPPQKIIRNLSAINMKN